MLKLIGIGLAIWAGPMVATLLFAAWLVETVLGGGNEGPRE